jgi:two-component system, NarL family, response regulator NreC
MPLTIVLADDHTVVHEGLRALLAAESDIAVIGEANDGLEAIRLTEKLQPQVLLVDLGMPNLNGLEVTRQVRKRFPHIKVIVLSMHSNEAYVLEAIRNGASGYVLKGSSVSEVIKAIRKVAAGGRFLSASLSEEALDAYIEKAKTSPADPYDTLTVREREILQMTAESQSSATIGRRLFISPRTVEIHRQNAMRKLGLRNQSELVRFALKKGILTDT